MDSFFFVNSLRFEEDLTPETAVRVHLTSEEDIDRYSLLAPIFVKILAADFFFISLILSSFSSVSCSSLCYSITYKSKTCLFCLIFLRARNLENWVSPFATLKSVYFWERRGTKSRTCILWNSSQSVSKSAQISFILYFWKEWLETACILLTSPSKRVLSSAIETLKACSNSSNASAALR